MKLVLEPTQPGQPLLESVRSELWRKASEMALLEPRDTEELDFVDRETAAAAEESIGPTTRSSLRTDQVVDVEDLSGVGQERRLRRLMQEDIARAETPLTSTSPSATEAGASAPSSASMEADEAGPPASAKLPDIEATTMPPPAAVRDKVEDRTYDPATELLHIRARSTRVPRAGPPASEPSSRRSPSFRDLGSLFRQEAAGAEAGADASSGKKKMDTVARRVQRGDFGLGDDRVSSSSIGFDDSDREEDENEDELSGDEEATAERLGRASSQRRRS